MADVIRETATHVVVAFRFSRGDFDHLVARYPSRGYALGALRILVQDALAVARSDVRAELPSVASQSARTSDNPPSGR
jgi:hypothetical protein